MYQDTDGASSCKSCAAGEYSIGGNLFQCPVGKYSNTTGSVSACLNCAPGSYAVAKGAIACASSPLGSYVPLAGASTFLPCPSGYYCPMTNLSDLTPFSCPAGTWCAGNVINPVQACANISPFARAASASTDLASFCYVGCFHDPSSPSVLVGQTDTFTLYPPYAALSAAIFCTGQSSFFATGHASGSIPGGACGMGISTSPQFYQVSDTLCNATFPGYGAPGYTGVFVYSSVYGSACPSGSYCPVATPDPVLCPVGTASPHAGQTNASTCAACGDAEFRALPGQPYCRTCPPLLSSLGMCGSTNYVCAADATAGNLGNVLTIASGTVLGRTNTGVLSAVFASPGIILETANEFNTFNGTYGTIMRLRPWFIDYYAGSGQYAAVYVPVFVLLQWMCISKSSSAM